MDGLSDRGSIPLRSIRCHVAGHFVTGSRRFGKENARFGLPPESCSPAAARRVRGSDMNSNDVMYLYKNMTSF